MSREMMMDDATLRELEQPESWDFEHAEARPGAVVIRGQSSPWRSVVPIMSG